MFQGYVSGICCSDLSHEVEEVELHGTRRGDKIIRKLVLHNYKSISSIERGDCNLSLKHVTATSSCVCTCCDFVPATCLCYMSPQCALHKGMGGGQHLGTGVFGQFSLAGNRVAALHLATPIFLAENHISDEQRDREQ